VAALCWSPWASRGGCVSRRPGPGLSPGGSSGFCGVSCGFFLSCRFPVSCRVARFAGAAVVRAVVALACGFGAVVWRSALAVAGFGAVVFRCGRGRRVPFGLGGGGVRGGLVGLGWVPARGSAVRRSGLGCLRSGGRAAVCPAVAAAAVACSGRVGAGGLAVPLPLPLFPAAAPVVGFSGSRRLSPAFAPLVAGVVSSVLAAGRSVAVGCAAGADSFARAAAPGARVFSVAAFGSGRGAFAARSVALVRAVAAGGPGSGFVVFPASPCPAGLSPSASPAACFCGLGSGSWASAAFAAGLGVPLVVFPCGFSVLPLWAAWRPAAPAGVWARGFLLG